MMGCRGHFGIYDYNREEQINYKILSLHDTVEPTQLDNCNCGVIWCLFVYDMMMQTAILYTDNNVYTNDHISITTKLGKTWTDPSLFNFLIGSLDVTLESEILKKQKEHCERSFKCFWDEVVIALERLRLLQLKNNFFQNISIFHMDGE